MSSSLGITKKDWFNENLEDFAGGPVRDLLCLLGGRSRQQPPRGGPWKPDAQLDTNTKEIQHYARLQLQKVKKATGNWVRAFHKLARNCSELLPILHRSAKKIEQS
jgi:hypothetical protein